MKIYIPDSIDLDEIIASHPPSAVRNFTKDKMLWILSEISNKPINKYDFAEIGSKLFQKKVYEYRDYIDYGKTVGLIEVDEQFFHSNYTKVKGYKFSDDYNTTVTGVEIGYFPLVKNLMKDKVESQKVNPKYKHLAKWFDANLRIDIEKAQDYLKFEMPIYQADYTTQLQKKDEINNAWFESYPEKLAELKKINIKDPVHKYNSTYMGTERISDKDYKFSVDETSYRFHSNLTNLSSDYRNFLSYDGEELVSIDIKNSQPYFSLKLLEPDFWKDFIELFNNYLFPNHSSTSISSLSYILVESLQSIDKQEVIKFRNLVQSGELYDYLAKEIEIQTGITYASRKEIKSAMFMILYSQNQFLGQPAAAPKRVFKKCFPGIFKLFAEIKKVERNFLPVLLQRLESYIILEVITKRISQERPKLPIFTIHDSIATTIGNENYVHKIMEEELEKFIGLAPGLRIEPWAINQLKNYEKWKNN